MYMIVMKLNPEPFEKIKSHKKIWEVRLNDDKRNNYAKRSRKKAT